jgi:hypothetical protein
MSNVPQLPRPGNPTPRSRDSSTWVDLIAFLAILALGGILIALGRTTAGSLATICVALGGLYGVWKRFRGRDEASPTGEPDRERDEHPR